MSIKQPQVLTGGDKAILNQIQPNLNQILLSMSNKEENKSKQERQLRLSERILSNLMAVVKKKGKEK